MLRHLAQQREAARLVSSEHGMHAELTLSLDDFVLRLGLRAAGHLALYTLYTTDGTSVEKPTRSLHTRFWAER